MRLILKTMKMIFKMLQSNICNTWQRALVVLMFVIAITCNGYGQAADYSERDFGTLMTHRNDPFPHTKLDSTIIPCRKLNERKEVFVITDVVGDISETLLKPFENLTEGEMAGIIGNAWIKRDTSLLPFLLKIAQSDTFIDYIYVRKLSVKSLSRFNTDAVKKVLTNLLTDNEVGMISAISLSELGQTEKAFQYIQSHYNESVDFDIIQHIVTTLMKINTPDAIKLLMKISEHKDPSQALDALAALSLLGYCDYSYKGFCKYTTYEYWMVRRKAANCLIYYTGSPEAIGVVKSLYYLDRDRYLVRQLEEEVFKKFDIFILTR